MDLIKYEGTLRKMVMPGSVGGNLLMVSLGVLAMLAAAPIHSQQAVGESELIRFALFGAVPMVSAFLVAMLGAVFGILRRHE